MDYVSPGTHFEFKDLYPASVGKQKQGGFNSLRHLCSSALPEKSYRAVDSIIVGRSLEVMMRE